MGTYLVICNNIWLIAASYYTPQRWSSGWISRSSI